jgi:2-amino-4-hydroxy-6-hydroxymethyldihydropteridine diphosphokinase
MGVRNPFLVALGSNRAEDRADNRNVIQAALGRLAEALGAPRATSRMWRTPAFPPGSGPDFVNACALFDAELSPDAMLAVLHGIEAGMGRERTRRWGPRVIDLDLLAQADSVLPDAATQAAWMHLPADRQRVLAPDRLILPHPRLQDRAFVLVPLAEIAPDWRHPVLGLTVVQMRDALDPADLAGIVALSS